MPPVSAGSSARKEQSEEASNSRNTNEAPPDYETSAKSGRDIHVLIVGESQQGKSTLIKFLGRYTDVNIDIEIGNSSESCTRHVGEHRTAVTLRSFKLVDLDGHAIRVKDYQDLCDLGRDEAQVVVDKDGDTINFTWVDTPGLDDSEGRDMEIMTNIIGSLSNMPFVNAVIYLRSIQKPLGKSFKMFFDYIQRSMPAISNGLVIVHSQCSTNLIQEGLERNEDTRALRKAAFKKVTNLDLTHFFMDNAPSKYSPFAVCESFNNCHKLLLHLKSQDPVDVKGFKLIKTHAMEEMDIYVVNALNQLRSRLEKMWNEQKSHVDILQRNVLEAQKESSKLKNKITAVEEQISDLKNGSDILLGTKSVIEDYSFLSNLLVKQEVNLGKRIVTYDSDCKIDHATTSASGGSRWLSEELRGTSWRGVLTAGWFRDLNGTATFYAKSHEKHRAEINSLSERLAESKEFLVHLEGTVAMNQQTGMNDELVKLGERSEACEGLVKKIEKDGFDVALYPLLKPFYSIQGRPSRDAIRDYVNVYNEDLADLL